MIGWFALTSPEASAIKHAVYVRRGGGFYYLYRGDAFEQAVAVVGRHWAGRVRDEWHGGVPGRRQGSAPVFVWMRGEAQKVHATGTRLPSDGSYTANTRSNAVSKGSILST